jgi:hypothetical protein
MSVGRAHEWLVSRRRRWPARRRMIEYHIHVPDAESSESVVNRDFHGPTRVAQTNHKEIACFCLPSLRDGVGDFCASSLALAHRSNHSTPSIRHFVTRTVALSFYTCFSVPHSPSFATCYDVMPLLETGRRRTKLDHSYNGPARQGPVRHISPVQLTLERIHEQNRANVQKVDPAKAPAPAPGAAARGKPRLLLMGQRR